MFPIPFVPLAEENTHISRQLGIQLRTACVYMARIFEPRAETHRPYQKSRLTRTSSRSSHRITNTHTHTIIISQKIPNKSEKIHTGLFWVYCAAKSRGVSVCARNSNISTEKTHTHKNPKYFESDSAIRLARFARRNDCRFWAIPLGRGSTVNNKRLRTFRTRNARAQQRQTETYAATHIIPICSARWPRPPEPFSRMCVYECTAHIWPKARVESEDCFMDDRSDGRELRMCVCDKVPRAVSAARARTPAAHSVRFDAVDVEPNILYDKAYIHVRDDEFELDFAQSNSRSNVHGTTHMTMVGSHSDSKDDDNGNKRQAVAHHRIGIRTSQTTA